jgi:hypothetical protein
MARMAIKARALLNILDLLAERTASMVMPVDLHISLTI